MDKYQKYLKIAKWLTARYLKNGALTVQIGVTPTKYTKIESLAWNKYILN